MHFLIAYDIAHPKRLARVAARLKRRGQRVQKSVFLFAGTTEELADLQRELAALIDPQRDRLQAWPLASGPVANRSQVGTALPSRAACVIVGPVDVWIFAKETS